MKEKIRAISSYFKLAFCLLLFSVNGIFAQTQGISATKSEPLPETLTQVSCKVGTEWYERELIPTGFGASSVKEAQKVIEKILPAIEYLPGTIIAKEAKVSNAEICLSTGNKYILYNPQWFKYLYKDAEEEWADIGIFAHEIAHFHLNHDSQSLGSSPKVELEADELAGKIMAKLKLTLSQALIAFRSEKMKSSGSHTHPDTEERIKSVKKGFCQENPNCEESAPPKIDLPKLFQKCFDFGNLNKFKESSDCWTEYLEADSKNSTAYFNRAIAFAAQNENNKSINDFTKAIDLNDAAGIPLSIPYNRRGMIYGLLRDADKAIADFTKAISIDPNFAAAFHNRGFAYISLKNDVVRGIADYTRAIDLSPENYIYLNSRGLAYGNSGQHSKAVVDFTTAIQKNPQNPIAFMNRGMSYFFLGEPEKAILDFSEAIKINPQVSGFYRDRAKVYRSIGKNDLAEKDENTALAIGN